MAVIFKMPEKLVFFHHNSEFWTFLRFLNFLGLYFDWKYFIENKFFVRFKMTSGPRWRPKIKRAKLWNSQHFSILSFAMISNFAQQHDRKSYFDKLAKNSGSVQDGGSKSDFLT
jgi:hypothetical protein